MPSKLHTNEFVAAFIACRCRMHLYADLDKLGERVLNCDTDSVVFVQKDGEPSLVQCRNPLGDMTSELIEN